MQAKNFSKTVNESRQKERAAENKVAKRTLILYTMNEIDGVKAIFDKIPTKLFDQFFVVDNHSTDGTVEYLKSRGVEIIQQKEPGRGAAFKEGLEHAIGDIIINLSSDGNEDPTIIPKMLEKFDEGYEMVTASRFLPSGKVDVSDDPYRIRIFGNRMCSFLVRLIWNGNVTDVTNGLRGFTRNCLLQTQQNYYAYEENFQIAIRCSKLGIPITEVPTVEQPRAGGHVKANTLKVMFSLPKVLLKEIWVGNNF